MLTRPFSLHGAEEHVDVMLEAKGMERALLFYRDELELGRKRETGGWPAGRSGGWQPAKVAAPAEGAGTA